MRSPLTTVTETVGFELITPSIADELLRSNSANRKLRTHRVGQYALIMQNGGWLLTGDAIVITAEGELINGQHRLMAVSESGCTVPFIVLRGANKKVYGVMDSGSPRTTRDLFIHNGVTQYSGEKASISRLAWAYLAGKPPGARCSANEIAFPNSDQCFSVYNDYSSEIDFAARAASDCSPLGAKSNIGFVLWLIAAESSLDDAEEFADLVSPLNRDAMEGDFAPRALRDHLLRLRIDRRAVSGQEIAYKFAVAFNAWMAGEPLARLTWEEGRGWPGIRTTKGAA